MKDEVRRKVVGFLGGPENRDRHVYARRLAPLASVPIFLSARGLVSAFCMFAAVLSYAAFSYSEEEAAFSYEDYASILKAHVNDKGQVDYKGLKANRKKLDAFLVSMKTLDKGGYEKWNDNAKIAFWLNAYNAITLRAIIDNYPIKKGSWISSFRFPENSIRQIDGVWDKLEFGIMGQSMTLEHIEHKILRAKFKEPRVHVALVCASVGCPFLRTEPYAGEKLSEQLDGQTKRFLSDRTKFRIDTSAGKVYVSPIFDWFGKDFEEGYTPKDGFGGHSKAEKASLNFMSKYLKDTDRHYLTSQKYSIAYLDYDWSLNEQR